MNLIEAFEKGDLEEVKLLSTYSATKLKWRWHRPGVNFTLFLKNNLKHRGGMFRILLWNEFGKKLILNKNDH